MSRSRWRNWRGHVLPKKLHLFKDLLHSDPGTVSWGDTSVPGGHGAESRYNCDLSCRQNACSVAAFPRPRFLSSPHPIGYHGNAAINMLIVQNIPHICSDSITARLQARMKATIQCPRERRYRPASNSQLLFLRCDAISDDAISYVTR